jgi:RNA polymerase sigma factor (sigma-70 family)
MIQGNLNTMPTSSLNKVIQHLLADLRPEGGGLTDGELLARFLRSRDEDALAALVRKHAQMVWGVCRRLLHQHDAEDAFQATFLVLVRKAADVPGEAVANWLYGVARQTAVRLRATAAKRRRRETQVVNMPEPRVPEVRDGDLQVAVDEELSRLPDHYRGVVVLCDLEGMTRKEAARQLGIPEGSVASRLARARVMLARRLTRRGLVMAGGSAAAVLSAGSASASAPLSLVASTIKAASLLAAGQAADIVSAKVAALTERVVKAMFVSKTRSLLAVVLVVGLALGGIGAGIGLFAHSAAVAQQTGSNPGDGTGEKPRTDGKADRERLKVLTPEEAIKQMPKENVTVQFKVASVEMTVKNQFVPDGVTYNIYLHDGGKFTALMERSANQFMSRQFMKHGFKAGTVVTEEKAKEVLNASIEDLNGKVVRVTGRVDPHPTDGNSIQMWVHDLADIEILKEEQNAPAQEPKPGEEKKPKAKEPMIAPPPRTLQKAVGGQITVHGILESVDAKRSVVTVKAVVGNNASAVLKLDALIAANKPAKGGTADTPPREIDPDNCLKLVNVPVRADGDGVIGTGVGFAKVKLKMEDLKAGQVVMLQLAADPTTGFVVNFVRVLGDEEDGKP